MCIELDSGRFDEVFLLRRNALINQFKLSRKGHRVECEQESESTNSTYSRSLGEDLEESNAYLLNLHGKIIHQPLLYSIPELL